MLAIARALVRDPKIMLLDEPFEGLAPVIVRDLMATCRELAEAGQTIVLVEQKSAGDAGAGRAASTSSTTGTSFTKARRRNQGAAGSSAAIFRRLTLVDYARSHSAADFRPADG